MSLTELALLLKVVDEEDDLDLTQFTGKIKQTVAFKSDPDKLMKSMIWMPVKLTKKQKRMFIALNPTPSR